MSQPSEIAQALNSDYEALHTAKEDAFWVAYMGLAEDAEAGRADFNAKEVALHRFLQDPAKLTEARDALAKAGDDDEETRVALNGWVRTFEAHVIESADARALAEEIIGLEGKLARARGEMELGYQIPGEEFVPASSVKLGMMVSTEDEEPKRQAAWEGLKSIEEFVLDNGFLDIVRARNRLGKMLGGEDYYDWKVKRVEGLSKSQIFDLLDDLEQRTHDSAEKSLEDLASSKGIDALKPWNLRYLVAGDVTREQDPYFPFSESFERWGRSFAALGINYRNAEMVLDLVDRKGKYENGFMHGPVPAWRLHGEFRPARIHFTANAIPGQIGSGKRATETLFHEGGHAAHFANVDMPAPCYAQEFAPTSVAFAEVQSMFLDSILGDADWQTRYAANKAGEPMPFELIQKAIAANQPFASFMIRSMLAVPYAERAIYEIPDEELSAERVVEVIRDAERRLTLLPGGSTRATLSIPHLLAGESSAYYHGYVMALVGVHQTRAFFRQRDGYLMDNPKIGPALRETYWAPGNSRTFFEFIEDMTGKPLSAEHIARQVNRTVDQAVLEAKDQLKNASEVPLFEGEIDLGARIHVRHGNEQITSTEQVSFADASQAFTAWIENLESAAAD